MRRFRASRKHPNVSTIGNSMTTRCTARGSQTRAAASQATGDGWFPWCASPPDPSGKAVEVRCEGWQHTRLWHPCGPPPENVRGLVWRHGDNHLRLLARFGGIYAPGDEPLHRSPPLLVDPSDENGPWALRRIIHPTLRPRRVHVSRLWLVPPIVLAELVWALDRGQSVVLRGPDAAHLRAFAGGGRNDRRWKCLSWTN